jgi:tetratricopeptide (TPR) repeat protein
MRMLSTAQVGVLVLGVSACATTAAESPSRRTETPADAAQLHLDRARAYYKAGRYQDDIQELDRVLRICGPTSRTLTLRGGARFRMKDFVGAERDLSQAISLDAKNADAFLLRGLSRSLLDPPERTGACDDLEVARQLGKDIREDMKGVDEWCAGGVDK